MTFPPTRSPSPRHEATPVVSDLELESAIFRGVANRRPVGRHKHILMISLQADVHEETGIWVSVPNLWERMRNLYDLEALDNLNSPTPSLPGSPEVLSPIPHPKRRRPRADSASSLSSPSPPPEAGPSRSAGVIDSEHFDDVFWLPGTVPPDRVRAGSVTLSGAFETPVDSEDEEYGAFHGMLYARAAGEEEDDGWEEGVKAQMAQNSAPKKKGKSERRASGGPDTSPLSSDAEVQPRKKTGRVRIPTKRARESMGDIDDDERPVGRRRRR